MSALAQKYELPANGASRVTNSCIAAALATIGIGGARQITEHRKRGSQDYSYFSFHLMPEGTEFPGFKTSDIVGKLQQNEIPWNGPWDEPTKLFMAAWIALENRRVFLEAVHKSAVDALQMRRLGEGLCRLEHPGENGMYDLRRAAAHSTEAVTLVRSKGLARALITVGFVPIRFLSDGVLMTDQSVTFPGLTLNLCLTAQGEILQYNQAVADALGRGALVMPEPPRAELPGGGPHGHPFENALQAGMNLSQIFQHVLPKSGKTYAFQSPDHATRSAIIDASATPQAIEEALAFATRR
jgi:hypothetical protein